MINIDATHVLCGLEVTDPQGARIGTVREVWSDPDTRKAAWALVDIGFLGRHHAFVPLNDAVVVPQHLAVSVPSEVVAEAPKVTPTGATMADAEHHALAEYYRTGMLACTDTSALCP
jgi:uncharacterized protein YrrD